MYVSVKKVCVIIVLIVKKKQILELAGELRTFLEKSVIQSCFMADVYLQFASGDKFFLTRMLLQI